MKYESSTFDGSKVIAMIKVFRNVGQIYYLGHKVINLGFN